LCSPIPLDISLLWPNKRGQKGDADFRARYSGTVGLYNSVPSHYR